MGAEFFQGGIFKIAAVHSNKVLDVPAPKKLEDSVALQQWVAPVPNNAGVEKQNENQLFMVFPVDSIGRYFVIASLASGKVLDVAGISQENAAKILQCSFLGQDNQIFELEAVPNKPDTYFIRAKHSGKLFNVSGESHADGAEIIQYARFAGDQAGNIQFRFEKIGEFTINGQKIIQDVLTKKPAPSPSEFPALENAQKPQNTRDWKPVGKPFLIPYFMVNDNNELWRIKKSPYYLLTREVCYTLNDEYFTYNNTNADQEYEVTLTTGFTTEEARNFTTTTGLELSTTYEQKIGTKVGAEADYGIAKVSGEVSTETSLSFTASASLSLGYSTSTSLSRHHETEIRRLVKCPAYTSLAVWTQTSRFTLSRLDSSVLKRWEVLEGGVFIDDFKITQ